MPLAFEIAAPAEEDALVILYRDVVRYMRAGGLYQWDDAYPNRAVIHEDLYAGTLYALRDDTRDILAAGTLDEHQDPEYRAVLWRLKAPRIAVVHRLCVNPSAQGGGLGRVMMAKMEARAALLGCPVMRLDTYSHNKKALALYHSIGYEQVDEVHFRGRPEPFFALRKSSPELT